MVVEWWYDSFHWIINIYLLYCYTKLYIIAIQLYTHLFQRVWLSPIFVPFFWVFITTIYEYIVRYILIYYTRLQLKLTSVKKYKLHEDVFCFSLFFIGLGTKLLTKIIFEPIFWNFSPFSEFTVYNSIFITYVKFDVCRVCNIVNSDRLYIL